MSDDLVSMATNRRVDTKEETASIADSEDETASFYTAPTLTGTSTQFGDDVRKL